MAPGGAGDRVTGRGVTAATPARPRRSGDAATAAGARRPIAIRSGGAITRPLKASESVARDIVDDIVVERMNEGDSLPPETAMLQHYGVSRETLREALRLLEVQGLISIRRGPGGGPIVGVVDPANLGRVSSLYYHLAGATYGELFEAWVICEPIIAELAAANPDRATVKAAMAPYLQLHGPEDEALDEFVVRHTEFHTIVGSLARNKVLQLSLMATGQIVTHHVISNADPRPAQHHRARPHADRQGHRQRLQGQGAPADGRAHPADRRHHDRGDGLARRGLHRVGLSRRGFGEARAIGIRPST